MKYSIYKKCISAESLKKNNKASLVYYHSDPPGSPLLSHKHPDFCDAHPFTFFSLLFCFEVDMVLSLKNNLLR